MIGLSMFYDLKAVCSLVSNLFSYDMKFIINYINPFKGNKSAQNVTFVFKYKWNHKLQTITIPAGTPIDLNFDWYGPAKMAELYGAN